MWDSLDNNFETQLDVERQTQFQAGQTGDFFEGVNAFLEKRQAKFTGKWANWLSKNNTASQKAKEAHADEYH